MNKQYKQTKGNENTRPTERAAISQNVATHAATQTELKV